MSRWRASVRQGRKGRLTADRNGRILAGVACVGVGVDDVAVGLALGRLAADGARAAAAAARLPRVGRLQTRVQVIVGVVLQRSHVIRIRVVQDEIVLD